MEDKTAEGPRGFDSRTREVFRAMRKGGAPREGIGRAAEGASDAVRGNRRVRARASRAWRGWRRRNAPLGAQRAGPPGLLQGGASRENQQGRRTARVRLMGTYASDDSDDEGSVVSVVRHGELASVVERRATQIRHVLRDGPPDSEEDTPPAVRACVAGTRPVRAPEARVGGHVRARGRGPGTVEALEAWREARQPRQARGVAGRAHDRGRPGGVRVATEGWYGRRRRSIPESSPPRYRDAYGDAYVAETVTDVHHYASPTLLAAPELPEPGRVASLARRYEDPRFFDPELIPMSPSSASRVERSRSPAGFALNAHASAQRRGRRARGAGRRRARPARRARALGGEDARARASHGRCARTDSPRCALALRDVQRRLTGVLAAVDGDEAGSVDLEALERADLDARARRRSERGGRGEAAELRAPKNERDRREAEARAARARAEAEAAARAEAETARARAARPSAAAARETNDATRVFVSRERAPSRRREKRRPRRRSRDSGRGPRLQSLLPRKTPTRSRTWSRNRRASLARAFRASRARSRRAPSELIVTTPRTMAKGRDRDERLGAAKRRRTSPSVPSALTRARAASPPRLEGTAAGGADAGDPARAAGGALPGEDPERAGCARPRGRAGWDLQWIAPKPARRCPR